MMTKTVSTKRILLSKIALLPLFSGLIFFICIESIAQVKETTNSNKKDDKIVYSTVIPTPSWTVSSVKNENPPSKENNLQIVEKTNKPNSGWTVSNAKNENSPSKENNIQIAEKTNKPNSDWTVSAVKREIPLSKEPEIEMSFSYSLKEIKANKSALQSSIEKIGNYITNTYKSPQGIDKKEETASITFFLKKDGSLTNIKIIDEKRTITETEMLRILKSGPNFIAGKNHGEADWNPIAIRMDFWPKEENQNSKK